MLTPEERLSIGLRVLERLKPGLGERLRQEQAAHSNPTAPAESSQPVYARPLTLETLLAQAGPLVPCSIVLGICEDGLPFTVDLYNPAPGSLLIAGDQVSGKARLLRAILASGALLSTPGQLTFSLITSQPEEFARVAQAGNCREVLMTGEEGCAQLLEQWVGLAEQPRSERQPALVLAVDDLASLQQTLDDDAFARLAWLARHGPRRRIWVIATLDSEYLELMDERLLAAFRTRLIGRIAQPEAAFYLGGATAPTAAEIDNQPFYTPQAWAPMFWAPFGEEWVPFWICDSISYF